MRIRMRDVFLSISALMNAVASTAVVEPRSTSIPSPLVIPPSQYWDGDDGSWSSFALRVGTPAQNVRVLVSTNSPETLVVLPIGCETVAISPVPSDCANSRGGLFNNATSSTWKSQGYYAINSGSVGFQADLGYVEQANFGLETVGLGYVADTNGPTLENQTVGAIATKSPFYTGIFGLSTQPLNYSTIGNYSSPSYFTSLWQQKLLPGLSWSYTAGAQYNSKGGQYAQLIFGGYDSSRFTSNTASFTLALDVDRDIVVAIQSITFSGTTQASLLSDPIYAFIESTDPNIWLPADACRAFEKAFGLSMDNSTGLYLMNSTQYSQLLAINPQVTFSLANGLTGGTSVSIILPFRAFALSAQYPFTPNDTYYFPLKQATNATQYTLGRAFLQEAYLTVDYERGNFSVSQCTFNDGATSQIKTILSPTYANDTASATPTPKAATPSKGIGIGPIIGIVCAALILLIAGGALAFYLHHRRRQKSKAPNSSTHLPLTPIPRDDYFAKRSPSTMNSPSIASITPDSKPPSGHPTPNLADAVEAPNHKHDPRSSAELKNLPEADNNHDLRTSSELKSLPEIFTASQERDAINYITASRENSQRRADNTPEIEGSSPSTVSEVPGSIPSILYELPGSSPSAWELESTNSPINFYSPGSIASSGPSPASPSNIYRTSSLSSSGSPVSATASPTTFYRGNSVSTIGQSSRNQSSNNSPISPLRHTLSSTGLVAVTRNLMDAIQESPVINEHIMPRIHRREESPLVDEYNSPQTFFPPTTTSPSITSNSRDLTAGNNAERSHESLYSETELASSSRNLMERTPGIATLPSMRSNNNVGELLSPLSAIEEGSRFRDSAVTLVAPESPALARRGVVGEVIQEGEGEGDEGMKNPHHSWL